MKNSAICIQEGQHVVMRDYFEPVLGNLDRAFVKTAEAIERNAKIEDHPFFTVAKQNRKALVLWASQEALVTNPFSQVLFRVISNIKNVHVRSILLPVVHGEHSAVRNGTAEKSHPWLIWRLCRSLGISEVRIEPTKALIEFVQVLERAADDPMRALGVLGIGNELMLLAEYRAVEVCFDAACPDADYRDFLHANIGEDEVHTALIGTAAAALTTLGFTGDEFIAGAREGVAARVAYYDTLLKETLGN
jgi:Iron-containing redox enzyme